MELPSGIFIYKGDIDKLERIQNRAVRFIKKDYKSRDPGSITSVKIDLEIDVYTGGMTTHSPFDPDV